MTEQRFPASPRKLRDARRAGYVWRSRELAPALSLTVVAFTIGPWTRFAARDRSPLEQFLTRLLLPVEHTAQLGERLREGFALSIHIVAPILALILVASFAASLTQPRTWTAVGAAPHRAPPVELGISILKLSAFFAITIHTLSQAFGALALWSLEPVNGIATASAHLALVWLQRMAVVWLCIAMLEAFLSRRHWLDSLRMTRREVEDELRETSLDPAIRRERERVRASLQGPHASS